MASLRLSLIHVASDEGLRWYVPPTYHSILQTATQCETHAC